MNCYKCNKTLTQGHEKIYPVPKDFSPHVLHFCDKCLNEWEGSDCEKNYDQQRLEAFKKELAKPNPDGENKDWMTEEIKTIKTKWNIKDQEQENPNQPTGNKGGLGAGAIIGIIAVILAVILGGVIYFIWQSKKDKENKEPWQ